MAMAVRTGGAWGAASVARVRCGGEPITRKPQQVSLHTADNTSTNLPRRTIGLSVSNSVDAAVRCQAAALTAAQETTATGVFEREVEMRCLEDSRASLRDNFEAASVSGRSECVSNEEWRPSLGEAGYTSIASGECAADVGETYHFSRVYHGKRGGGDAHLGLTVLIPAKAVAREDTQGTNEMVASFEAALQEAGRNAEALAKLAVMAWRKLGDADRAEELYNEALELSPEDSNIQASYTEFLWQCDA